MRRVSHYEHAFRAGRGEPVERVPHPEHPDPELGSGEPMEPWQPIQGEPAAAAMDEIEVASDRPPVPAEARPVETVDPVDPATPPLDPATTGPLRVEFQSSNIRAAELDAATGVLTVEFANGKQYRYGDFTAELFAEWQAAKSAGSWFDANVKKRPDRHPPIGK